MVPRSPLHTRCRSQPPVKATETSKRGGSQNWTCIYIVFLNKNCIRILQAFYCDIDKYTKPLIDSLSLYRYPSLFLPTVLKGSFGISPVFRNLDPLI